jgi:DNA-binding LytR/AlgR family response regulator
MAPALTTHNYPLLQQPFLLVGNTEACYRIPVTDVVYCTSHNSSTVLQLTNNRKLVAANPISHYETLLAPYGFVRTHQSYLINTAYLHAISKGEESNTAILTTGEKLPVARARKTEVQQQLRLLSIEKAHLPGKPNNKKTEPNNSPVIPNSQKPSTE